jgi:hypothetical protein
MARGRNGRPDKAGSAFLVLWMTFWLAAILIAVWTMGAAALSGEPAAAIFLLVWVGMALFGLVSAGRSLRALLLGERPGRRPHRNHGWNDGLDAAGPPAPPPPPPADRPASGPGRPS